MLQHSIVAGNFVEAVHDAALTVLMLLFPQARFNSIELNPDDPGPPRLGPAAYLRTSGWFSGLTWPRSVRGPPHLRQQAPPITRSVAATWTISQTLRVSNNRGLRDSAPVAAIPPPAGIAGLIPASPTPGLPCVAPDLRRLSWYSVKTAPAL